MQRSYGTGKARLSQKNYSEFKTNGLSQVSFFNSCTRFLSGKMFPRKWELADQYSLSNSFRPMQEKKLNEHPETAATLLFMGRQRKSILHLEEARSLFELCLGERFMTAQSHKAIGDFHFVHGTDTYSTEEDKSSEHYKEALTMMEKTGHGRPQGKYFDAKKLRTLSQRERGI